MISSEDHEPAPTGEQPPVRPSRPRAPRRTALDQRRGLHWFFAVVGWCLIAGVTILLYLRWRAVDRALVIGLVGLTPLLAAPQLLAVVSSWLSRSPSLRVAAAISSAAFLFTMSPVDAVVGCGAASAPDEITIYTANVMAGEGRPTDIASSIIANDPDIVVMQEIRWPFVSVLREDPRLDAYAHRSDDSPAGPDGTIVWSRWPIVEVTSDHVVDSRFLVHTTIDGPHGRFILSGVHTTAPARNRDVDTWLRQFDHLARIETDGLPRILAGDFNATADHQPFRHLLGQGWTDVHGPKGCGFDATWPVDQGLPFPMLRLDHVLVTDHFEVLRVDFGDPAGSDHKPVVTAIRPTGA